MAWYRTGGGGIPASLKTGMNGVLNKKFSTSTTYAPDTWVDTVNLMGKLPEKTVTGSIAHISDGADRVPMKNLICTIAPTLEGVSSVEVVQTGKNSAIFSTDILTDDRTQNGVTFHATSENTVYISGTATGGSAFMTSGYNVGDSRYRFLKAGTYTLSCNMPNNGNYTVSNIVGYYVGETERFSTASNCKINAPKTFTLANDAYINIQITVSNGYAVNDDIWVQIEVGSTATDYEPYVEPTTITVPLGQTIHGGSVDVVTGAGKKTWKEQNASEFQLWQRHNQGYFYVITSYTGKASGQNNVIGEDLVTVNTSELGTTDYCICGRASDGAIYVRLTGTETLEEFHEWIDEKKISFELETPIDFTVTPITPTPQTALGVNNIYNNTGETSVTYRRDITLALEEV